VLAARSHALIVPNVGAIPFAKDARIRLLGVTSQRRSAFLRRYRRRRERSRIRVRLVVRPLAPAKTPQAVIARINAEVAKLLRDPVILGRLASQGVEPRALSPGVRAPDPRDYDDMARLVKAVGRIE